MADSGNMSLKPSATVRLMRGELQVSLSDGEHIAAALRHFLETDARLAQVPMLNRDSAAWLRPGDEALIDFQGQMRIGLWLLQGRDDQVVLTYRPVGENAAVGYQYLARLGVKDDRWYVDEIGWEKIYYSR